MQLTHTLFDDKIFSYNKFVGVIFMLSKEISQELETLFLNHPGAKNWARFCKYIDNSATWFTCWNWLLPLDKDGYGKFHLKKKPYRAHRAILNWILNGVSPNLVVDHLVCNNQSCVNPLHLLPVTTGENTRRHHGKRKFCTNGHSLTIDNLHPYYAKQGYRVCATCHRERNTVWWRNKRAERKAWQKS